MRRREATSVSRADKASRSRGPCPADPAQRAPPSSRPPLASKPRRSTCHAPTMVVYRRSPAAAFSRDSKPCSEMSPQLASASVGGVGWTSKGEGVDAWTQEGWLQACRAISQPLSPPPPSRLSAQLGGSRPRQGRRQCSRGDAPAGQSLHPGQPAGGGLGGGSTHTCEGSVRRHPRRAAGEAVPPIMIAVLVAGRVSRGSLPGSNKGGRWRPATLACGDMRWTCLEVGAAHRTQRVHSRLDARSVGITPPPHAFRGGGAVREERNGDCGREWVGSEWQGRL